MFHLRRHITILSILMACTGYGALPRNHTVYYHTTESDRAPQFQNNDGIGEESTVRYYLYQEDDTTFDGSSHTWAYKWSTAHERALVGAMYSVASSSVTSTYVEFTFSTNNFATNVNYGYASVIMDGVTVFCEGSQTVYTSPGISITPSAFPTYSVLLSLYTFIGTFPNANLDTDLTTLATPAAQTLIYTDTNGAYQALSFVGGASKTVTIKADESAPELTAAGTGDITGIDITAGTGMTGTVATTSGQHTQTLALNSASVASLGDADTAYGWGDHSGLYDVDGTAAGLMAALVLASPYVANLGLYQCR